MSTIASKLVHLGRRTDNGGFAGTNVPIEPSSAFVHDDVRALYGVFEGKPGVVYSRLGNPTVSALEDALGALDGGTAVAMGSGMAAIHAAWLACQPSPDRPIVVLADVYGSTRTVGRRLASLGTPCVETGLEGLDDVLQRHRPALVHVETISNPLTTVHDIEQLARRAHDVGARLVVDATFSTPVMSQPIQQGADIVVHSLTKYIGGHGDLTGGVAVAVENALARDIRRALVETGPVLSPFDAWLALRGLRTLELRMDRHADNAMHVALGLRAHHRVAAVHYPGLPEHPQHTLAASTFGSRFGGMLSFELADATRGDVLEMIGRLQMVQPATTLGDVASLAISPVASSHRDLNPEELAATGIVEGLVRLSVGIESATDILDDVVQAMDVD